MNFFDPGLIHIPSVPPIREPDPYTCRLSAQDYTGLLLDPICNPVNSEGSHACGKRINLTDLLSVEGSTNSGDGNVCAS